MNKILFIEQSGRQEAGWSMEREAGIPEGERSGAMRLVAGSSHRRGYHPPQPDALTRLDDEQWSPAQGQAGGQ